ncbi:MAG: 2-dehydro-3-deoxy-D-gluconate 5-dehydrogenase KduD [Sediminispirochaetaceae bacterium]
MSTQLFDLSGKIAVVTGANKGLGQGIAIGLAEAGADIVAVHRSDVSETKKKVEAIGRRFASVQAELSDMKQVKAVIPKAAEAFGSIDILVNNAGVIKRHPAVEFPEDDWDLVLDVNLKALFLMSQAAARKFIDQGTGGKIINIASMLSYQGGILVPSYTASKSAVIGLTRALANEWAAHNINVNGIAPGYMVTDNTEQLRKNKERYDSITSRIPAGRWGSPSDLQGAAVFLASAASEYVNGFTIAVDGGWLSR